jgi:hypothetical protein
MVLVEDVSVEAVKDISNIMSVCAVEQDSVVMVQETWGLDRIDQVRLRDQKLP